MADDINALDLIVSDHRNVEQLFTRYESTTDPQERTRIAHEVIHDLAVHGEVEELIFYPRLRKAAERGEQLADRAIHEHVELKQSLNALDGMTADEDGFDERMQEVMAEVRSHVREEEGEIFPEIRRAVSEADLRTMGRRMQRAKSFVPTRPHPHAPTSPAGKAVAGPPAALVDRIRDAVRKAAEGRR